MKINTGWAIIALVFGVVMLIGPTVYGQANPLPEHGWALQFAIDRDFDLNSFQGSTLSIKKHTSAKAAWRLGVSVDWRTGDIDETRTIIGNGVEYQDVDYSGFDLGINLQRVFYVNLQSPIKPYIGVGSTGGISFSHTYTEPHNEYVSNYTDHYKSRGWNAGLTGVFGVEWMPHVSIGLFAEYKTRIYFEYHKTKSYYYQYQTVRYIEEITKRARLTSESVKLGLAVYF